MFNPDDDRIRETVRSREELEEYLRLVANTEFYANAPRADGEFLDNCDDDAIVEDVLKDYEQRLEEFFEFSGDSDS